MWKNWTGCFWLQFIKAWTWTVAIVGQKTIDSAEKLQKIHTKKKKILSKPFQNAVYGTPQYHHNVNVVERRI